MEVNASNVALLQLAQRGGEDDAERVLASRERNREHAKKTRLRKKALLEGMKTRLLELQKEVRAWTVFPTPPPQIEILTLPPLHPHDRTPS